MTALGLASAFGAGALSGVGPCVAPRIAVVLGLMGNRRGRDRVRDLVTFLAGLCTGYFVLGSIAGGLRQVGRYSSLTYGVLAVVLIVGGLTSLTRSRVSCACLFNSASTPRSASFLAGAAFSGIGTPCCGPLAAATALGIAKLSITGTLAAFFLGHAAVLAAVALPFRAVRERLTAGIPADAITTVSAAVAIGMGAYYGLIA